MKICSIKEQQTILIKINLTSMKKIITQSGRLFFSVFTLFCLTTANIPSQSVAGKSSKPTGKLLDFNGDGREDLINVQQLPGKLSADGLSFNGKTFSMRPLAESQNEMVESMKWFQGDFNGDGKTDIAKLWDDNGKMSCDVHLSDGTKLHAERWITRQGEFNYGYRWLTGDFNADGLTDIAKINTSGNQISVDVYLSTGKGFTLKSWISNSGSWDNNYSFLPGDFTGDGATDIAIFRGTSFDLLTADPANNAFTFKEWSQVSLPYENSHRLFTGDFNGDKKLDVAKIWISNDKANIDLFLSEGGTLIGKRAATELGKNEYGMKWFTGDFNGDGKTDLVKIFNESGKLKIDVYIMGNDSFTLTTWLDTGGPMKDTQRWFAGDFNGDGKTDLAVLDIEKGTQFLSWYEAGVNNKFIAHEKALKYPAKIDRALGNRIYTHKFIDPTWIQGPVPGDITNVRDAMASGQDVFLVRGETYNRLTLTDNLNMSANQQIFSTFDATYISDFATIKMTGKLANNMVNTQRVNETLIENLIGDGNRYGFDAAIDGPDNFTVGSTFISGGTTSGQRIKRVIALNSRCQSAFKLQENNSNPYSSKDNRIENCIVFGSGVDARGSGCNLTYKKGWADAMGMSCTNSVFRDNLVIDGTDVGIVLFTAPGCLVEKNVIVTLSRETLGAINMVDFLNIYKLKEPVDTLSYYDYKLVVRNNFIDAFGARFHNGIPTGDGIWSPNARPTKYGVGQTITGNIMVGDCFGYGISVRTGKDMTITGNISYARHTGVADGFRGGPLPDPATDFIMESRRLINCKLQPEFKEAKIHISHLLFMNLKPRRPNSPYKFWEYTPDEANGIVTAAFIEMMQRLPKSAELASYTKDLIAGQYPADSVRRILMKTNEFITRFGTVKDNDLHNYRTNLWMSNLKKIDQDYINETGDYPSALLLYNNVLNKLSGTDLKRFPDIAVNRK
jgi:FG-GAP-like repeat